MNRSKYTIDDYIAEVDLIGLHNTWENILSFCESTTNVPDILQYKNFGELYEIGMAHVNKVQKKELGKYYTPCDIADVMSEWLLPLKGDCICDVCCGTGNLILRYLHKLGYKKSIQLLSDEKLFLYDTDPIAMEICKRTIGLIYGRNLVPKIHCIVGDFLNRDVILPNNCKVISNPPYFKITTILDTWEHTSTILESKEFYSAIMEKIIQQSASSVIITPYSFIGGSKFYSLRCLMNLHNGFIVSFDNVPGSIFNGRKHGIFNTNSSNSVRAAITVTENDNGECGYRLSPLIRFKSEERTNLLNSKLLKKTVGKNRQTVNNAQPRFAKYHIKLESLFKKWHSKSNKTFEEYISTQQTQYSLCMPNSCRYFTVATIRNLDRVGKNTFYFNTELERNIMYCFINSSFAYWHWRIYDGGINYPVSLLNSMPIFFNTLSQNDIAQLNNIAIEMQNKESMFLSYKKNANKMQETVKFPEEYREKLNSIFAHSLLKKFDVELFDLIHANSFFASK